MRSASSTSRWSSAIRILVTVYFSTSYLSECQFLCNVRATQWPEHLNGVFTSDLPLCVWNCLRLPVAIVGFDCPDAGTHFDSTLARNQPSAPNASPSP